MKLSPKALALAAGFLWGGCVFLVGLANLFWPTYGVGLLEIPRSIYPGYAHTAGFWGVIVGTLYALLDGAVGGWIFAWIYNVFAPRGKAPIL